VTIRSDFAWPAFIFLKIYNALKAGDVGMAEEVVKNHLDTVTSDVLEHQEKMRQAAFVGNRDDTTV
jgi:DNA-binding GntR family transcriptional regulator